MVSSKEIVDEFLRKEMKVRYEVCEDYEERETKLIKEHTLPLNIRGNRSHPFYSTLKKLRKKSKETSLGMI
jgi:hypothetical protein